MEALVAAPFVAALLPVPLVVRAKLRQQTRLWQTDLGTAWRATAIIALWLLHPAVMRESILVLLTRRIGNTTYAAADLSVQTDDPQYATTRSLALALLVLFVVGYPLGLAYYVYGKRQQLRTEAAQQELTERERSMLFYFYGSYKPRFYYWELVAFCTKVAFVLISAHASIESDPGVPLFWATVVALTAFVLEVKFDAYCRKVEGRLIKATWFALLVLLLIAQGMVVGKKSTKFVLMLQVTASATMLLTIFGFVATFSQQCYRRRQRMRGSSLSSQQGEVAGASPSSKPVTRVGQQRGEFTDQNPMHATGIGAAMVGAPKSLYASSHSLTSEPEPEPDSGVVISGSGISGSADDHEHEHEQQPQEAQI